METNVVKLWRRRPDWQRREPSRADDADRHIDREQIRPRRDRQDAAASVGPAADEVDTTREVSERPAEATVAEADKGKDARERGPVIHRHECQAE